MGPLVIASAKQRLKNQIDNGVEDAYHFGRTNQVGKYLISKIDDMLVLRDTESAFDVLNGTKDEIAAKLHELLA